MAERQKREGGILQDLASHKPMQDARGGGRERATLQDELRYAQLSQGHERPATIIRNAAQGDAHSREVDARSRTILRTRRHSITESERAMRAQMESALGVSHAERGRHEERRAIARELSGAVEESVAVAQRDADLERIAPLARENARISGEIRTGWMSEELLGRDIYRRFTAAPPYLTTEPDSLFNRQEQALSAGDSWGYCFWDTNHLLISDKVAPETDRYHVIAHEQFHYAAWLGGGTVFRYRGAEGEPIIAGYLEWLHEGLTELNAQHLVRANGRTPSLTAYPAETAFCRSLELFVIGESGNAERGQALLGRAYLSGDMSEVRRLVDGRLGAGSFDVIMGRADMPSGGRVSNGAEALAFFLPKLDAAKIDYSGWRDDPVIRLSGIGLK
ncbi:MAG: hypothetical protein AB1324_08440 [Candidatus Micrarchaeota archaeon]